MGWRIGVALAGFVLAAGGLAACGGGDGDDEGGGLGSAGEGAGGAEEVPEDVVVVDTDPAPVTALDNSFRPENVEVAAGTEVVWTNQGRNDHNLLPAEGDGWGVEAESFGPGDTYSHSFDEPGVYRYYCSLHGTENAGMVGALVVTEAGEAQG